MEINVPLLHTFRGSKAERLQRNVNGNGYFLQYSVSNRLLFKLRLGIFVGYTTIGTKVIISSFFNIQIFETKFKKDQGLVLSKQQNISQQKKIINFLNRLLRLLDLISFIIYLKKKLFYKLFTKKKVFQGFFI